MIGAPQFALMKPTSYFINIARGELVDEAALVDVLRNRRIAGAALDVFDGEPLAADHLYRSIPNLLATPHIGYVTEDLYRTFYQDTVSNIASWMEVRKSDASSSEPPRG